LQHYFRRHLFFAHWQLPPHLHAFFALASLQHVQLTHLHEAPHWQLPLHGQSHFALAQSQPTHLQSSPHLHLGQLGHWQVATCVELHETDCTATLQSCETSQHSPPVVANDTAQNNILRNIIKLPLNEENKKTHMLKYAHGIPIIFSTHSRVLEKNEQEAWPERQSAWIGWKDHNPPRPKPEAK
jgi:hypothetical protein